MWCMINISQSVGCSCVCVCLYGWEIVCEIQFKSLYFIYHHIIIILIIISLLYVVIIINKKAFTCYFYAEFVFYSATLSVSSSSYLLRHITLPIWFTYHVKKMRFQLKMYKLMLCVCTSLTNKCGVYIMEYYYVMIVNFWWGDDVDEKL